ncbi:MAG: hypothetical protein CMJ28_00125 [Phycisphaerae bacterium]|nr:hypothetical protein [Phycisphaerae bacterium]
MFGLLSRLDRMVIKETLRSVGYTLVVVLVLAVFGAALRPLSGGDFDSAGGMAEFLFLVALPMLEYSLPLAAGLGATLAVYRMANDGEVVTVAACGRSPFRLVLPVATGGLLAGLLLALLSNFLVPKAWGAADRVVARGLASAIARSVERGEAFDTGDVWIHASDGVRLGPDEGAGLEDRVQLDRVTIVSRDSDGLPSSDISARRIDILVYAADGNRPREMELRMRDAVMSRPEDGVLASIADPKPIRMYDPEDPRRRRAKVQTTPELSRWMDEPDRSPKVMKILDILARSERDQRVMASVDAQLRTTGFVELRSSGDGEIWHLSAKGVTPGGACLGSVGLQRISEDQSRSISAPGASLEVTDAGISSSQGMEQWLGRSDAASTGIRLHLPQARVDQEPDVREISLNDLQIKSIDLQALPLTWQEIEPRLQLVPEKIRERLQTAVQIALSESTSNRWFRLAMPATLPGLTLLGATLALRLRGRPLLLVWTLAYLPALLSMLLVVAGTNAVRTGIENAEWILAAGPIFPLVVGIFAALRSRPA